MSAVESRAIRFHEVGEPLDVLQEDQTQIPDPGEGRIRVRVAATGLNPADWELCRGFMLGALPRGIGVDVSGTIDAIGDGVADVAVGDAAVQLAIRRGALIATAGPTFEGDLEGFGALVTPYGARAAGQFTIPVAKTFPLEEWRAAAELSLSGAPHGKVVLVPDV